MNRFCLLLALTVSTSAFALPPEQSDDDRQDDATITLTVLDRFLVGDAKSFCKVRIQVVGEDEPFRAADRVFLEVFENDFIGDDPIWSTDFAVTPEEVADQNMDRTLDCSSNFGEGDGVGGNFELKAKARVEKDACSGFCRFDRPTTGELSLEEIAGDDDAEEDDASGDGSALPLGNTEGRIARDADWFALSFLDRSVVTFRVLHRDAVGRVEAIIFDDAGGQVAVGVAEAGETVIVTNPLPAGSYNVRVQPADGNDYNFYDLALGIVSGGGCDPASVELRACGACGEQRRTCLDNAMWGEWGVCGGEGQCAPGAMRSLPCGNCGTVTETCDNTCGWAAGACENEGMCEPGAEDVQDCPGGMQRRLCDAECQWTEFAECESDTCSAGESRQCYTGPVGSVGVGLCAHGEETCVDGEWDGECVGAVLPADEICDDTQDNDCDGTTDGDDDDCGGVVVPPMAELGDPCSDDDECGADLICLRPDDAPAFREGYCSVDECAGCPAGGVCGRAFGRQFCLKRCQSPADCTAQQRCADVTVDRALACIPVCSRDSDCIDPNFPICDRANRLCVPAPAPPPDRGVVMPPLDMGPGAGGFGGGGGTGGTGGTPNTGDVDAGTPTGSASTGCSAGSDLPQLAWLCFLLLPAVRRRR